MRKDLGLDAELHLGNQELHNKSKNMEFINRFIIDIISGGTFY